MTKKLISIITSIIMCIGCFSISVSAKVIEPEVVKTESWTTSYYIDDDMDTLYPYIQCEADIYNDGTIKLWVWNTHEWDGFATVSHTLTIMSSIGFYKYGSKIDILSKNDYYIDENSHITYHADKFPLYSEQNIRDLINFYDAKYTYNGNSWNYAILGSSATSSTGIMKAYRQSTPIEDVCLGAYISPLCNIPASQNKDAYVYPMTFVPTEDPTGTYNFRLFGHDITITPELLSGNIISEPELTEQEKYIKQLEEENARLKASITNTNLFGDINGDNLVDVADAQMILNYYVYTLVDSNAEPLEEWISKQ